MLPIYFLLFQESANPFYDIADQSELRVEVKKYLVKRLNEGVGVDLIKREIKFYLLGARLAEDLNDKELGIIVLGN